MADIKEQIKDKTAEVNTILSPFFSINTGVSGGLDKAMEYALLTPGKRMRPMMMREAALLFGEETECLHYFMAAIEMIHNYSLVHDDLPAMDNDLTRHGRPSCHAAYGEDMAILAGDSLLNIAFETCGEAVYLYETEDKRAIRAFRLLAENAGAKGMAGGQALDLTLLKGDNDLTIQDLELIHNHKTGKLFEASLGVGAILGGADSETVESVKKIGRLIGLAFQITDDILDADTEEEFNYVKGLGLEGAKELAGKITHEAIEILETLPGDKDFLKGLFLYLVGRNI